MASESPLASKSETLDVLSPATNRHSSPSPTLNMIQQKLSPPSKPPPPSVLKFSFAKGAGPVKPILKAPSNLSDTTLTFPHQNDSENEDESHKISKVTHLENGTIIGDKPAISEEKKPLIIKPPESHSEHWLQRRLKMFRPEMVDNQPPENVDLSSIPDRIGDGPVKVGLQITKRPSTPDCPEPSDKQNMETQVEENPKTEDELAKELLLRQAADPNAVVSTQPKLIIPASEPLSEQDIYAYDMAQLPEAPSLEDYERVPIEAFGMGILLGLGWKEGTDLQGQKMETFKEPKKRPDFLGIGAKEEEFLRVDAKGKKISRKEGLGASWNPLKKINKRTGEVMVEDGRDSRRSTPGEKDRSRVSTPREDRSRYDTPSGGRSDYDSGRERDNDRNSDRRRDDDRHRREKRYQDDDRRDRRYDSDRESKRKNRECDSDRRRGREYDSDHDIKRRRERDEIRRK